MNGTLSYSIGIKNGETCINALAKGVALPAYVRKNYSVKTDGQETVVLELFKNDSIEESVPLGDCTPFTIVEMKLPAGVKADDDIEIIYTIGLNGLLIVTCKCNGSIVEKNIDL